MIQRACGGRHRFHGDINASGCQTRGDSEAHHRSVVRGPDVLSGENDRPRRQRRGEIRGAVVGPEGADVTDQAHGVAGHDRLPGARRIMWAGAGPLGYVGESGGVHRQLGRIVGECERRRGARLFEHRVSGSNPVDGAVSALDRDDRLRSGNDESCGHWQPSGDEPLSPWEVRLRSNDTCGVAECAGERVEAAEGKRDIEHPGRGANADYTSGRCRCAKFPRVGVGAVPTLEVDRDSSVRGCGSRSEQGGRDHSRSQGGSEIAQGRSNRSSGETRHYSSPQGYNVGVRGHRGYV